MRKSNIIIALIAVIASAILLYLWFHLGFNKVDNPTDLVVAIAWWVIVAAAVGLIGWSEKKRQQAVRTVFLGEGMAFNPEVGAIEITGSPLDEIEAVIEKLQYGFNRQDLPEDAPATFDLIIKSTVYKVKDSEGAGQDGGAKSIDWEGEVIYTESGKSVVFSSKEELGRILAA